MPLRLSHSDCPMLSVERQWQVTAHALVRLWATQAMYQVLDTVMGRPLYLVDFHCFAIPQRCAPEIVVPCPSLW